MTAPPITCPDYAPFFGMSGATFAMALACVGAAYGTARSGVAIAAIGTANPSVVMSSLIPVIMAGILTIYGLVVSMFIATSMDYNVPYSLFAGALHMAAGLTTGLCSIASGYTIGVVGDAGVRGIIKQPRIFVGLVLILIFAEVLGLYGMIAGIMTHGKARDMTC